MPKHFKHAFSQEVAERVVDRHLVLDSRITTYKAQAQAQESL
jgi:hypothetical protein